ncbi:Atu4866 domain-containing protein [Cellulophaga sp. 1_MG-2023]|nr:MULTISPECIES: Atu4866 domain-containing protein [Cellulophaga]MDO6768965.1 Atu4866 domain-containing protein [Cellulophaga sp. 1_MG-2023]
MTKLEQIKKVFIKVSYQVIGNHIDCKDDKEFSADGDFRNGNI